METITPWAMDVVRLLAGFTEVSPSGTGVHVWVRAKVPGTRCRRGQLEIYDDRRFVAVTGRVVRP
jgi:primase-polymerase (primpol)-like protein